MTQATYELTLVVASYMQQPDGRQYTASSDRFPVRIGRADDNDLTLDDPEYLVSGQHALIHQNGQQLEIENLGINGTYLNTEEVFLSRTQRHPLSDGDVLFMGDFQIQVKIKSLDTQSPSQANSDPFARAQTAGAVEQWHDPFGDPLAQAKRNPDPFSETPTPIPTNPTAHIDPFANDMDFAASKPQPELSPPPISLDDAFEAVSNPFDEAAKPAPETTPRETKSPASLPLRHEAENSHIGNNHLNSELPPAAMQAFLKGLGAEASYADSIQWEALGRAVRLCLKELQVAMQDRNAFKSEMNLEHTVFIRRSNSNPLKLPNNADTLLAQFFSPKESKHYMDVEQATTEAFNDLKVHQIALSAGMHAALQQVLSEFSPKHLETKLNRHSPVLGKVPLMKSAQLWDLFSDRYREIEAEIEQEFNRFLKVSFAKAYNEEAQKLKGRGQSSQ